MTTAKITANAYLHKHERMLKAKKKSIKEPGPFEKGVAALKKINKGLKAAGKILSFAEQIKKNIPIYI